MRVRKEYDQCSNQSCPNDDIYNIRPSWISSLDDAHYRIELQLQSQGQTIQSSLNESHNSFTDHALVSCEEMGHPCSGRRRTKTTVSVAPILLKVYLGVFQDGQHVVNASQFETHIVLHNVGYRLVGAILFDGSHFRSLNIYKGKFLRYDGRKRKNAINYMKWIGLNESFGKNWRATSFWYFQEDLSEFSFCYIASQHLQNSQVTHLITF